MVYLSEDTLLLSFPKSGRTWLRYLVGSYLNEHFLLGLPEEHQLEVQSFTNIRVLHDDDVDAKPVDAFNPDKSVFSPYKIILLVRDPRDVVVSWYFEKSRRHPKLWSGRFIGFEGTLSEFIRSDYGIRAIARYLGIWANHLPKFPDIRLVRYEDLKGDTTAELTRILQFLGIETQSFLVSSVVEKCSFQAMRSLEEMSALNSNRLKPVDIDDPESFKVRRAIVGGYRDYLAQADLDYCHAVMAQAQLAPYDYTAPAPSPMQPHT
ncbi:MAG TPA: sulfotransferase domain-containing protein [Elainellaceae cyanobacterium]